MNQNEAEACLREVTPEYPGGDVTFGIRNGYAYVTLCPTGGRSGIWAEVSSPGDFWYRLRVDGSFTLIDVTENPPDLEVEQVLREYVRLALQYLEQRPRPEGKFNPKITVATADGDIVLVRPVASNIAAFFARFGRR